MLGYTLSRKNRVALWTLSCLAIYTLIYVGVLDKLMATAKWRYIARVALHKPPPPKLFKRICLSNNKTKILLATNRSTISLTYSCSNRSKVLRKRSQKCPRENAHSEVEFCMENNGGRLGNKMFQYSTIYGLSKRMGVKAVMDNAVFDRMTKVFDMNLNETFVSPAYNVCKTRYNTKVKHVGDPYHLSFTHNQATETPLCDRVFGGFFQSWMYTFPHLEDIKRDFKFNNESLTVAKEIFHKCTDIMLKMPKNMTNIKRSRPLVYVGIHARHGDITRLTEHGNVSPSFGYYHQAIRHFLGRYRNVAFIVGTDDRRWSTTQFGRISRQLKTAIIVSNATSGDVDMAVLSMCNHTIMSVGTFGVWTSILTGGDVVYYTLPGKPASGHGDGYTPHKTDFYLPYWVGLPRLLT